MTAQGTPASDTAVLRIVGEFTIFRAAELMAALLATPAPREVDLSGVTELDTAGLQLLMLAKKKCTGAEAGISPGGAQPGRDRSVRTAQCVGLFR